MRGLVLRGMTEHRVELEVFNRVKEWLDRFDIVPTCERTWRSQ